MISFLSSVMADTRPDMGIAMLFFFVLWKVKIFLCGSFVNKVRMQ